MVCANCKHEIVLDTCYVNTEDNAVVCSQLCGMQYMIEKLFNEKFEKILTKEIS